MIFYDSDQPLGEEFLENPYEFFQTFVRGMNNEIFLSEYQLNYLYALLLLRKESPWDRLKPNDPNLKKQIQDIVNLKVADVKKILESLSQMYEDKFKKNSFAQLQKLMSILKARNKSIFIEKDFQISSFGLNQFANSAAGQLIREFVNQKSTSCQEIPQSQNQKDLHQNNSQQMVQQELMQKMANQIQPQKNQSKQQQKIIKTTSEEQEIHDIKKNRNLTQTQNQMHSHHQSSQDKENNSDQREVLSLFYGLSNIPNLSSLALGNCLEYSAAQRFIRFKMSKTYIMTIKNEEEPSFDRISVLKNIPASTYIHNIFPYLTAIQLFKVRSVCRQWMENVKQAWHSTFKREMFIQLMACEFCKQIEFHYKLTQLRNPFFQKISLLMHALLEIIQWDRLYDSILNNTIVPQLKKVLIILLKLLGEDIVAANLNSITEQLWLQHKEKTLTLKQKAASFLNNIESSGLNIIDLIKIKLQLLDDPFMRVEELTSEDKTPMLLVIFIKQLTLQQILKNHITFSQEYLIKTKARLDNVASRMPQQKGFLEGVYKILLLKNFGAHSNQKKQEQGEEKTEMPNFSTILTSIFQNTEQNKPDFVLKSRESFTNIYMDKATKFDIIYSTMKKMNAFDLLLNHNRGFQNQTIPLESQIVSQNTGEHRNLQPNSQIKLQDIQKIQQQNINVINVPVIPNDIIHNQQLQSKLESQVDKNGKALSKK